MQYKLVEESERGLRFKRTNNARIFQIVFGGVGAIVASIGLILTQNPEINPVGIPVILTGFGAAFMSVIFMLGGLNNFSPIELFFDNGSACLRLQQDPKFGEKEGIIPYAEIAGFRVRTVSTSSSSGNTTSRSYSYLVYIQRKDGGRWDLYQFGSERKAEVLLATLNRIDLSLPFGGQMQYELPAKISVTRHQGHPAFEWKNEITKQYWGGMFMIACFFVMGYGIVGLDEEAALVGYAFMLFGAAGILLMAYYGWQELRTTYRLRLTDHEIQFIKDRGDEEIQQAILLPEIHAAFFNYDFSQGGTELMIISKEELEKIKGLESGSFAQAWEAIKSIGKSMRINVTGIDTVEKLHFELGIQELIKRKTGYEIL